MALPAVLPGRHGYLLASLLLWPQKEQQPWEHPETKWQSLGRGWGRHGRPLTSIHLVSRASEMAQGAKVPSTKPDNLSSIPGTHLVEGGK